MLLGWRNEIWARGSRFVVCRSSEVSQRDGRVLSGHEAEGLIAELLRGADAAQVRELYFELSQSLPMSHVSNPAVLLWFSHQLGGSAIGAGSPRLCLVQLTWNVRRADVSNKQARSEAEHLVHALETAQAKKDLEHRGHHFRLMLVADARAGKERAGYETLGAPEAQRLLEAMATDTRLSEPVRELLRKAGGLAGTRQNGQSEGPLLLLRRRRPIGHLAARTEPPTVPAQGVKARAPKERSYIVVAVSTQDGAGLAGVMLELTAPDGSIMSVSTDETGEAALYDIKPGSYRIAVLSLDLASWKAGGAAGQLL